MRTTNPFRLILGAFQARLSGSISADRDYTLPNKNGTFVLNSDVEYAGRRKFYGARPATPNDGDLWEEQLGYDVPWEWNASLGLWLAPVRMVCLPVSTAFISSQPSNRLDFPLNFPDTTYGIYIRNVLRIGSAGATGSSSTACWNVLFGWWNGTSNSLVQINSFNTSGYTVANQNYRNNSVVNTNYLNPFGLYVNFTKTGSPPATSMGITVDYRISRT